MRGKDRRTLWQSVYAANDEREVSWFKDDAQPSRSLIEEVASPAALAQ
jgi:hypothetical protein